MIIAAHYPQVALGPSTCFSIFWVTSRSRTLETDKAAAAIHNVDVSGLIRIPDIKWTCNIFMSRLRTNGWVTGPVISSAMDVSVLAHPDPRAISHHKRTRPTVDFFFFWSRLSMWCMPTRERTSSLLFFKNARPKHSWRCTTPEHKPNNGPKRSRNSQECPACSCLLPNRCLERRFFQTFQRRLIRFT